MKIDDTTFCNVCSAEIPEGEESHEFSTRLLAEKGHCHAECLTQRNEVLREYEQTVEALSLRLDPSVSSPQKIHQAITLEARRGRALRRTQKAVRKQTLPFTRPVEKKARKRAS